MPTPTRDRQVPILRDGNRSENSKTTPKMGICRFPWSDNCKTSEVFRNLRGLPSDFCGIALKRAMSCRFISTSDMVLQYASEPLPWCSAFPCSGVRPVINAKLSLKDDSLPGNGANLLRVEHQVVPFKETKDTGAVNLGL